MCMSITGYNGPGRERTKHGMEVQIHVRVRNKKIAIPLRKIIQIQPIRTKVLTGLKSVCVCMYVWVCVTHSHSATPVVAPASWVRGVAEVGWGLGLVRVSWLVERPAG